MPFNWSSRLIPIYFSDTLAVSLNLSVFFHMHVFDLYPISNIFCFVWIGFLLIPAHESLSAEEVICQVIVYRTHDPAFIHHKVGSPSVSKSSLCRNQAINPFCTDKYSSQAKRILVLEKYENRSAKFKPAYKKSHIVIKNIYSINNVERIQSMSNNKRECYNDSNLPFLRKITEIHMKP